MEIILLSKIYRLGELGEKVTVKPGYGRNYLIPKKLAVPATAANIKKFEEERVLHEQRAKEELAVAQKRVDTLNQLSIVIKASAADEGKLYGSVGVREIAEAVCQQGVELKKSEIRLPTGAIRYTGEYEVEIQLHSDIVLPLKITVAAE